MLEYGHFSLPEPDPGGYVTLGAYKVFQRGDILPPDEYIEYVEKHINEISDNLKNIQKLSIFLHKPRKKQARWLLWIYFIPLSLAVLGFPGYLLIQAKTPAEIVIGVVAGVIAIFYVTKAWLSVPALLIVERACDNHLQELIDFTRQWEADHIDSEILIKGIGFLVSDDISKTNGLYPVKSWVNH